jgi:ADP-ribosylglycohydrolase
MESLMITSDFDLREENDFMIRSYPLALLRNYDVVLTDTNITNPNNLCRIVNQIYVRLLSSTLNKRNNKSNLMIDTSLLNVNPTVKKIINLAINKIPFNFLEFNIQKNNNNWCLFTLYCLIYCLVHINSFEEAMEWTVNQGGDISTNLAIVGTVMGAKIGYDSMLQELHTSINISIVLLLETDRPKEYTLHDIDILCSIINEHLNEERIEDFKMKTPKKRFHKKAKYNN